MARPINPSREPLSEERKRKISEAVKAKWNQPEYRDAVVATLKAKGTPKGFSHPRDQMGSKNPNWKGGQTTLATLIRKSRRYVEWRKSVRERDDFTCQECGKRGGDINVHHRVSFASILTSGELEKLWDIDNGVTLCEPCHLQTKSYSRG